MKLNLLPTYVGKEKAVRSAIFLSLIIALAGVGAAAFMIISSRDKMKQARDNAVAQQAAASAAVAESKKGDIILQNARILIGNTNLAAAMDKHNHDYPDLFDTVRRYVPSYFRVTSMSAAPAGDQSVVTLQGAVQTQQQYADLMLALLRIPGATSVDRSGYQPVDKYVPALSEGFTDIPIRQDETPVPRDPYARFERQLAQGGTQGFLNANGFGVDDPTTPKGPMPNWSLVTVQVVVPKNIQTPNPLATLTALSQGGGGGGTQPAGGGITPNRGAGVPGPGGPPGGGEGRGTGGDTGDDR